MAISGARPIVRVDIHPRGAERNAMKWAIGIVWDRGVHEEHAGDCVISGPSYLGCSMTRGYTGRVKVHVKDGCSLPVTIPDNRISMEMDDVMFGKLMAAGALFEEMFPEEEGR